MPCRSSARSGHGLTPQVVNYRDLDAEELGSIYEALLEYVPSWDGARRAYTLGTAAGNARKTTGSYYTPTSLIESLLDTALDPVLDAAEKRGAETGDPAAELLAVTVVRSRLWVGALPGGRRASHREAGGRGRAPVTRSRLQSRCASALREVVGRCIYGVDLNPLAAELAKVSLWLDAMEPGQAAGVPRRPDQGRQRAGGCDSDAARRRIAAGGVQAHRG